MRARCVLVGDSGTSGGRHQVTARNRGVDDARRWGERLGPWGSVDVGSDTEMLARPKHGASDVRASQLPVLEDPRSVALVAGTLGGNELGWRWLLLRCSRLVPASPPSDEELRRWASRLHRPAVAAWSAIRLAAPNAAVVSVGYPHAIWWPRDRRLFTRAAVERLDAAQRIVDEQMSTAARVAGVHYVSLHRSTTVEHTYGWVWGLIPGVTDGPSFHLTDGGHGHVATVVTLAIGALINGGAPVTAFGLPRNPDPELPAGGSTEIDDR